MLSRNRNKQAAKRFFRKLLGNLHTIDPRVINIDKSSTLPPALGGLQAENKAPKKTKLRAVKYLNNSMENDHKSTKLKSRYRQWYPSFRTARNTLDGMETMRIFTRAKFATLAKMLLSKISSSAVYSN